jgi:hypothetical protein
MTEYKIREDGRRNNFTILPNIIDTMGLSLIAYRLYGHLKRIAGESGECYQSGRTIAKETCMSTGAISKAKDELTKAGLIKVEVKNTDRNIFHSITIVDIWDKNNCSPHEQGSSYETLCSPHEELRSPGETIKIYVNKNQREKELTPNGAKRKSNPLSKHPTIQSIKEITGKYPSKVNYQSIIEKLGESPNWNLFKKIYEEWCLRGYNPINLDGIIKCYEKGSIFDKRNGGNGVVHPPDWETSDAETQRRLAEAEGTG